VLNASEVLAAVHDALDPRNRFVLNHRSHISQLSTR
jgi:hypothetical protein